MLMTPVAPATQVTQSPAKFSGEKPGTSGVVSIEVFIRKIEANTRAKHWTDEQRILLVLHYMSGNAQTRLENRGMYCIEEWETFKRQMLSAFAIKPELRYTYFTEYKPSRRKGESVAAFIDCVANDLDSFDNSGQMPEEQKHREIRRM